MKLAEKNQVQQSVHKPCSVGTPNKNHEVVRTRSGQVIHKPHRLGIDILTNKRHTPYLFLSYAYSEGKGISRQQTEDKTKIKITPITILLAC